MAAIKKLFRIKVKVLFTSFHIFTGKNIAINFKINKMNFKIMLVVKTNQTLQSITNQSQINHSYPWPHFQVQVLSKS